VVNNSLHLQLIDEAAVYNKMKNTSDSCTALLKKWSSIDQENSEGIGNFYCQNAYYACHSVFTGWLYLTGLNQYDIREKCKFPQNIPQCYNISNIITVLSLNSTKEKWHVSKESRTWEICNLDVNR